VHESLGTLDVIVKVVTEGLDEADGLLTVFLGEVAGEEHKGDIGDVVSDLKVLDALKLDGGIAGVEENLGGVLKGRLTPGIDEFLRGE